MNRSINTVILLFLSISCFAQVSETETLFTTELPVTYSRDARYELGTEFNVLSAGNITGVRLYTNTNESGDHIIRLWRYNGSTYVLTAGPYTWNFTSGITGWREYTLPAAVEATANTRYIISVTNSTDFYYVRSESFSSATTNDHISYIRGLYSTTLGSVPSLQYNSSCYFRDIIFTTTGSSGGLTAGTIGNAQVVCYNSEPSGLVQLTAPTGGTGEYTYQWQVSTDNSAWTDISGATQSGYSPPALTSDRYYRRRVSSGSYTPANSNSVLITVSPQFTQAQLHDNVTIYNNSSTTFNVVLTGGTAPYTINYTRNGSPQGVITNYTSGSGITTGVLTTGTYVYSLTSVTDAAGCQVQNLGSEIIVTVTEEQNPVSNINTALVIVNSASSYYSDFVNYINPYLIHFGIPYEICDVHNMSLPTLTNFGILIFGHRNVYSSGYPLAQIESALIGGVGLYSFDNHLFDYSSGFNSLISPLTASSSVINITNYTHFITEKHSPDAYSPSNNIVNLRNSMSVVQGSSLVNPTNLVFTGSVPLLQVATFGNGKIARWNSYAWIFEETLGPVYGMDDLIWRSIAWAARKPFVMQGLPPMITMRVDDSDAGYDALTYNFEWVNICNEFGIIPWLGTFNNSIPTEAIPVLRTLLNNNLATASPHAFSTNSFIFFNHNNLSSFDAAANTRQARQFYINNGLPMSKYLLPHYYEISLSALEEVRNMGCEFIGTHMLPDNFYFSSSWINNGPYRKNRYGTASSSMPVYYAENNTFNGISFFNCVTEIRDDGGYEWYPSDDVSSTSARGIRHLRRSINSMVLPTLFTHEYFFDAITITNFRQILNNITSSVSEFAPLYTSMDYAIQYIRAKSNLKITKVEENTLYIEISISGNNDMPTKCYLFTGQNDQISFRLVDLPQVSGITNVIISKD